MKSIRQVTASRPSLERDDGFRPWDHLAQGIGSDDASQAKRSIDDLRIFGGACAFPEVLHVGRPNIGDTEAFIGHARAILDSRWLSNNGPYVQEFERRIAEACEVPYCIATSNATAALEILVHALGLKGEVIVPSFTFIATAHALKWLGIEPVFCDVDPLTHTLDPARVEELITERTTAVLGVHVWGQVCEVDALQDICTRHGLRLFFDAAHAFGCRQGGRAVGGFGDAEVLSFHATKFINSFEGGAILTRDPELAKRARLMRNFGFEYLDSVVSLGINAKMTEICAAMGLVSLDGMEGFMRINRANHLAYQRGLAGIRGLSVHALASQEASNHQYVVVEVDEPVLGLSRDQLLEVLMAEGVLARRYFHPGCHRMEPYRSQPQHRDRELPVTERLSKSLLQLPTGQEMTPKDIEVVCALIQFVAGEVSSIRARLAAGTGEIA